MLAEPLTSDTILRILRRELPALRKQFGVKDIALYGSFAKGRATPESDIDLVVSFEAPIGLAFVALAEQLESLLGRRVHLVTLDTVTRGLGIPRYRHVALDIQETLIYA